MMFNKNRREEEAIRERIEYVRKMREHDNEMLKFQIPRKHGVHLKHTIERTLSGGVGPEDAGIYSALHKTLCDQMQGKEVE